MIKTNILENNNFNKKSYINNNSYNKNNKFQNIQCLNCGFYGHGIRTCNYPITSYGIICYLKKNENIEYLMIQRKDSLCYIEFLRGRYKPENMNYLLKLFKYITPKEKENILKLDFDILWEKLWRDYDLNKFKKDYNHSKNKFNKIKNGYLVKDVLINFNYLINNTIINKIIYNDTEWEWPKGRRNLNEHNIKCAIREFEEESGLPKNKIELLSTKSYEEVYIAVNNVRYRHVYYIAKCTKIDKSINNLFNPFNKIQVKEVKNVKWLNYDNVLKSIRDIYVERIELFKRIDRVIKRKEFNDN
jgi:8-oxo-dGTP pyrophosphatase MutT (NUDIX family)|tara:strand:+ start:2841 stop:3746 length:906 start_codon:yes stop_codon:yes gene_type:complete